MIPILYCDERFVYSKAFREEYERRVGKDIYAQPISLKKERTDPVAIDIWYEKGGEWCSATPDYAIELCEIPAVFARHWTVTGFIGGGPIIVRVADAYADLLHEYMSGACSSADLVERYRELKQAERVYYEGVQPPLLKRRTLVNPDELSYPNLNYIR